MRQTCVLLVALAAGWLGHAAGLAAHPGSVALWQIAIGDDLARSRIVVPRVDVGGPADARAGDLISHFAVIADGRRAPVVVERAETRPSGALEIVARHELPAGARVIALRSTFHEVADDSHRVLARVERGGRSARLVFTAAATEHVLEDAGPPVGSSLPPSASASPGVVHTAQAPAEASLQVTIVEGASSRPVPVRVRLTRADGTPVSRAVAGAIAIPGETLGVPPEAIAVMYGQNDVNDGFGTQPDGSFYVDGPFAVALPPGEYRLEASKGYEYVRLRERVTLAAGSTRRERYTMRRWVDMPSRGWYSSDDHIHLRRSPRENPLILRWIAAEDVHVGHLLQMGDYFSTFYTQYAFGPDGRYQERGHILSPGQEEPRTPEIGHTISLGHSGYVRPRHADYYRYDTTFDRVRALGGVAGYAHQGATFHGSRGMTLDVLHGKLDFLELMQFCAPGGPLLTANYYRFLDLGFPLTATAGSDFPWCGRTSRFGVTDEVGPHIGDARFYTYVGGPLTFDAWLDAMKAGRTFATTGPMLFLTVDGERPGATLDRQGGDVLDVVVEALGHSADIPLARVDLVVHGVVVASAAAGDAGQSAGRIRLTHRLPVGAHGLWVAARAEAGPTQAAHTTPVYVRAGGRGFRNPATFRQYLDESARYLDEIERELAQPGPAVTHQMWRTADALRDRIAATRAVLKTMADEVP